MVGLLSHLLALWAFCHCRPFVSFVSTVDLLSVDLLSVDLLSVDLLSVDLLSIDLSPVDLLPPHLRRCGGITST